MFNARALPGPAVAVPPVIDTLMPLLPRAMNLKPTPVKLVVTGGLCAGAGLSAVLSCCRWEDTLGGRW